MIFRKAGIVKRIAAGFLDAIMLCVLCAGIAFLLSSAFGYDSHVDSLNAAYDTYEDRFGVSFDITEEEYNSLTDEEKQKYSDASEAMNSDADLQKTYGMVINLSLMIITISLLVSFLALEIFVPMLFGNGQTLGKKAFSLCLVRVDCVRITGFQLFVRSLLGKFAIEAMVPVYLVILLVFGSLGIIGSGAMLILAVVQLCIMLFTANNSLIHDLIAGTAVADMSLQKIFNSSEELLEYKNKLHAERVANSVY